MLSVTKIVKFDAAHWLPNHEGKCKNLHGHTWKVEIEVSGQMETGMIIDFSELKKTIQHYILVQLDHTCLNERGGSAYLENPTAENLCLWIHQQLDPPLAKHGHRLVRVRVWESEDSYAEWKQ